MTALLERRLSTHTVGKSARVRRALRNNSLSIAVISVFLLIWLIGQTTAGLRTYNAERRQSGDTEVSFGRYLTTAHFGEATFENWESEFLQMGMYVVLTVKLRQRGSSESKRFDAPAPQDEDPLDHRDDPDAPWPVRRGGWWLAIYRNSLSLTFMTLFLAAFLLHALTGSREFNNEQASAGSADRVSTWGYMHRSQFWFESLQNWQSEFLAVAAIVVLSIVFRQYGSPESKPVHAPHSATGD
jgi:succinate dehydrogenase hydrophobic anchor subunit